MTMPKLTQTQQQLYNLMRENRVIIRRETISYYDRRKRRTIERNVFFTHSTIGDPHYLFGDESVKPATVSALVRAELIKPHGDFYILAASLNPRP